MWSDSNPLGLSVQWVQCLHSPPVSLLSFSLTWPPFRRPMDHSGPIGTLWRELWDPKGCSAVGTLGPFRSHHGWSLAYRSEGVRRRNANIYILISYLLLSWLVLDALRRWNEWQSSQGAHHRGKTPAEESWLKVKENNRAHTVFTEFGGRNDCVL